MGAADVRLEVVRASGRVMVLADGRALSVPPGGDPREVAIAAVVRHAIRRGRVLRVEFVDDGVSHLRVGPSGPIPAGGAIAPTPFPTPPSPTTPPAPGRAREATAGQLSGPACPPPRVEAAGPHVAGSAWRRPPAFAPTSDRRPVGSLVAAVLVAVAVLVGAVGTGVATLASSQTLPDSCRPVTLYAVGGAGGASDVLTAVTDPLAAQFGEKVSVVTVPPPAGGSYAAAESAAVGALSNAIGDHVEGCPSGTIMMFGYSAGAQVAGDLASRIGTGLEPRIPATLVSAVGLFGDPARSPATRVVPDGTTGQGVLPPRAVEFGALDARTIQICAPGDPVCDSPPTAANASLDQALAAPAHASYSRLAIAQGTTAPQWAAASLGKVIAAVPDDVGPAAAPATPSATAASSTTAPAEATSAAPEGTSSPRATSPESTAPESTSPGPALPTTGASGTGASDPTGSDPTGSDPTGSDPTGSDPTGSDPTGSDPGYGDGADSAAGDVSTTRIAPQTRSSGAGPTTEAPTEAPTGSSGSGATTTRSRPSNSAEATGTRVPESSGATTSRSRSSAPSTTGEAGEEPSGTTTTSTPTTTTTSGGGASTGSAGAVTKAAWSLTDGLEGFKSTPWNNQNATDPSAAQSPNVPGREAVKFEMPAGGKRTEAEPDVPEFTEGETKFVGYSGFFDQGFPTDVDTWQLIMQFKQSGTGSPPLAVEVGKGQLRLANNGTGEKDFCPVEPGAPFSFQLGITFGGGIDAYCNGQQTLQGYKTPDSNVKGSAYLKTGIYRDESIGQDSTLFLNDLKVGDDLAAVSGLAGSEGGEAPDASASGAAATTSGSPATTSRSAAATTSRTDSSASAPASDGAASDSAASDGAGSAGGGGATGEKVCDKFGSTKIDGGAYMVQNNEWGAADGQCVTATAQGFTVDSGDHAKNDAPAAYPSIMSGCWMGTCTTGTTLPTQISRLGPISSSIAGRIPDGTKSNLAYDIWADSSPEKDGHNDALELMIWLKEAGGIKPIGDQAGTATIGGATWDVWKGTNGGVNVISYVRQGYVDAADDLPITDFVNDAVKQGSVQATDYLTNIQAGFEPWTGGPGMALTRFGVTYGGGAPATGTG